MIPGLSTCLSIFICYSPDSNHSNVCNIVLQHLCFDLLFCKNILEGLGGGYFSLKVVANKPKYISQTMKVWWYDFKIFLAFFPGPITLSTFK